MENNDYLNVLRENIFHEKAVGSEGKKEFDSSVQKFFPMIWNSFGGVWQILFPIATSRNKSEEIIQKKHIHNLDLNIRTNSYPGRMAYTYPSMTTAAGATFATWVLSPAALGSIGFVLNGYKFLNKNSSLLKKAKNVNGVIVFPSELKKLKILSFLSKGLMQQLKEEERTAILLHEIGHWVNMEPFIHKSLATALSPIARYFPFLNLPILIGTIVFNRKSEWKADAFAKQVGYGNQLANALENITINTRKDAQFFQKINDYIIKFMTHISNVIDVFLPISPYPSIKKRTNELRDSESFLDNHLFQLTESELIMLNEGIIKDKINEKIAPLCHAFDKNIAKQMNKIFPIK